MRSAWLRVHTAKQCVGTFVETTLWWAEKWDFHFCRQSSIWICMRTGGAEAVCWCDTDWANGMSTLISHAHKHKGILISVGFGKGCLHSWSFIVSHMTIYSHYLIRCNRTAAEQLYSDSVLCAYWLPHLCSGISSPSLPSQAFKGSFTVLWVLIEVNHLAKHTAVQPLTDSSSLSVLEVL